MGIRLALLPLVPIPAPIYHDEFSYLLGADTFASGRVTNPSHPLWVHFETFHVNPQPTYCSKYPPAQALFLAFGQRFLGNPWFGVCLSSGFMFAALCWMLQGWVLPKYAVLTTLLSIVAWGLSGEMINSYWGGAVAAGGGALVIGAIPRLIRRVEVAPTLFGAAGLALLANSRPYEGLLTAAAASAVLAWRVRSTKRSIRSLITPRTMIPFLMVMAPVVVAMAYYNYRTTGKVLLLPYALNQKIYAAPPLFYLLPLPPAGTYRHENIRKFWVGWVRPYYEEGRTRPFATIRRSILMLGGFYLLTPFVLAMIAGVVFGRSWQAKAALIIVAFPLAGLMFIEMALPHYLAPAFGALLILGAVGLQRVGSWPNAAPILIVVLIGFSLSWCAISIRLDAVKARQTPTGIATRPLLIDRLERAGGRQLVIVRYGPDHDVHAEWVYNRANIDAARIVWAQDMGDNRNRELLDYYRDRKVWLLQPDVDPLRLTPYLEPPSLSK